MKGFIFGFQRFVWCPKWTPASNSSGTNSVVSAIKRNSRGRELPERECEDATARVDAQPEIAAHMMSIRSMWKQHASNWKLVIFSRQIWPGPSRDRKAD